METSKSNDAYQEDSTMRKIHRIQKDMEQQYLKSGLPSYWDWLQATEEDMHKSLAEVGFEIVTRNGRTFLDEIKPRVKKSKGSHQSIPNSKKDIAVFASSPKLKPAKHKSYDNYSDTAAARELPLVREDRAASNKIAPQSKKPRVKYKSKAAAQPGKTSSRQKPAK